jgi:hypothetical protein
MSYPLDDSFWVYRYTYIQARAQPTIDANLVKMMHSINAILPFLETLPAFLREQYIVAERILLFPDTTVRCQSQILVLEQGIPLRIAPLVESAGL